MYDETVTLSSVIKEVYEQKKITDGNIIFNDDFEKNTNKKLRLIARGLGIEIKNYRVSKNNYEIPRIVADILVIYLIEESKKGSFISKISTKNYKQITKEEKFEFLNKVVNTLRDKYKNHKDYSDILESILEVTYTTMSEINFSHGSMELIEEINKEIKEKIDSSFKEFTNIKYEDGLIRVNDRIYLDKDEISNNINIEDLKYDNMSIDLLSKSDKIVFIQHLKEMIFQTIDEWNELRRIANEIKHCKLDDLIEDCNGDLEEVKDKSDTIEERNLLRMSIDEYKRELIEIYIKKDIVPNEEMDQILEDIKKEIDRNK